MTDTTPFLPARPTIYKGIEMRSRLEARFAAWMDRNEWEWAYEPECFATEEGQYLPDFEILSPTPAVFVDPWMPQDGGPPDIEGLQEPGERWFIEVKPTLILHQTEESWTRHLILVTSAPEGVHHHLIGMGHASPLAPDGVYQYDGLGEAGPLWRSKDGLARPWFMRGVMWDDFVGRISSRQAGVQWPWGDDA